MEKNYLHKKNCQVNLPLSIKAHDYGGECTDDSFEISHKSRKHQLSTAFVLEKGTTKTQGGGKKKFEQEMFDQCCITRYQKNFTLATSVNQVRTFLIFFFFFF